MTSKSFNLWVTQSSVVYGKGIQRAGQIPDHSMRKRGRHLIEPMLSCIPAIMLETIGIYMQTGTQDPAICPTIHNFTYKVHH